jgi:hypothetical protein
MSRRHVWLLGFLICTSAFSLVYAVFEEWAVKDLAHSRDQLRTNLADAQAKLQTLSSQLSSRPEAAASVSTALPPPAVQPFPASSPVRRRQAVVQRNVRPRVVEEPRWRRVESQLADHQSQLAKQREQINETQENIQKTGDQLDGRINSTRDELNRSIATTHDEVVLLQKRGERNVYEFDLAKSKQFQRVGPLSLSLRKVDAKHRIYDLTVMVDDVNLDKKHVNLLEPVWINLPDRPQPVQLVVNKIDKNQVRGYISEPRYKTAELPGPPTSPAPQTPTLKTR